MILHRLPQEGMYRSVIHGKDLIAWWPFDDDRIGDNIVASKTGSGLGATLYNVDISSYGRFGKGLHFQKINQMLELGSKITVLALGTLGH